MKNITSIFICAVLSVMFCMCAKEDVGKTETLRQQLQSAATPEQVYNGSTAYVALMHMGKNGFEALANAWAYDDIAEENWVEWNDNFMTRYDKEETHDLVDAYYKYWNHKLDTDEQYAIAAVKRLNNLKVPMPADLYVAGWLLDEGGLGARKIGHRALKQKYPDLPAFDYQAPKAVRARQYKEVEVFLRKKENIKRTL